MLLVRVALVLNQTYSCPLNLFSLSATAKSDIFCSSFRTACVKAALEGKDTGSVTIREGCQRNGKKYSNSYSFVCKVSHTLVHVSGEV